MKEQKHEKEKDIKLIPDNEGTDSRLNIIVILKLPLNDSKPTNIFDARDFEFYPEDFELYPEDFELSSDF